MALRVETQIPGDVVILHCEGRIVLGDEGAVLRERVGSLLPGTRKIVVSLTGVEHIDSAGLGVLVGLLVSARNRGGDLLHALRLLRGWQITLEGAVVPVWVSWIGPRHRGVFGL